MKNSRTEGVLFFNTKKPFKVTIDGKFEDRTEVICHDVNSKCENAALDLEQLLISAMVNLKGSGAKPNKAEQEAESNKSAEFFKNDSPKLEDIQEQAKGLEMGFMMNTEVKISEVIKAFGEMVASGVISTSGDVPMTIPVWERINIKDKSHICFMYCAFFVNPLERL